jgi:putative ABC transport system permease protein
MTMTPKKGSFSDRMFRRLMRLFPFEFRGEYQSEMEDVFREQCTDVERHEGFRGMLRLWWETLTGIFRTAPREHLEMLRQDGGYALRMMAKQPGFTAIALLTLALGIGANTAIFSVVYGVLLRPLPYREGNNLVQLNAAFPGVDSNQNGFSVKEIADYRAQNRSLDQLAEYHSMSFDLVGHGEPQRVRVGVVSPEFFDLLGLKPQLGTFFTPQDDKPNAPWVMVISNGYWVRRLGSDRDIIGKTFRMNSREITAVGVLPPVPMYPDDNDLYMPPIACPFRSSKATVEGRDQRMMSVYARLKPGVTLEQANADLQTVAGRLSSAYPESYPPQARYTASGIPLRTVLTRDSRTVLILLLAATGMVLLITCANVANLTLARLLRRERELAVRASLGAGPARLLRQLVTESTILALAGGALGVLLGSGGLTLLMHFAAKIMPRASEVRLDGTVLTFTAVVSILTGIVFGAIPAMAARRDLSSSLQSGAKGSAGGPGRHRLRGALVVSQVAVSFMLLVGAGLMVRTLYNLLRTDPGFRPQNVLTMLVDLDWSRYRGKPEKQLEFFNSLLPRVEAQRGVVSAAISRTVPLDQSMKMDTQFLIEGRPVPSPVDRPRVNWDFATPDYFRTLGTPLLHGRFFTDADGPKAPEVAVINQSMARHFWPGQEPLAQRVSFDGGEHWSTIVGVVGDIRQFALDRPPSDEVYFPFDQNPSRIASLYVRATDDPKKLSRQLTSLVYELDPAQPVARIRTLDEVRSDSISPWQLTTVLLGLFAGLALAITAAGLAGVTALSVSQRTQEIGIRMALGATPGGIFRMVLGQGLGLVVLGVAIGVTGGLGLTRLMSSLLVGVRPEDALTLVSVAGVLLAIAAVSCFLPARRAASVAPMVALRWE